MSYIKINQLRDSKRQNYTELSRPKKNIAISTSNIFIGGGQNLKGMRIHLSNSCKKNNTSHKEVLFFFPHLMYLLLMNNLFR